MFKYLILNLVLVAKKYNLSVHFICLCRLCNICLIPLQSVIFIFSSPVQYMFNITYLRFQY